MSKVILSTFSILALLAGCASTERGDIVGAQAAISPASGSSVTGLVTFRPVSGDGLRVIANLSGIESDGGDHGFHVHETGDCSAADASSAGGHFNPEGNRHGAPEQNSHHAGDLGNITVTSDGEATLDRVYSGLSLRGSSGVIGRAVVLHAKADDLTSQPSGAAGARIGCGVISAL